MDMDARHENARAPVTGWKSELMELIATKGRVTARARDGRSKPVSNATMEKREKELFRAIHQLHRLGYKIQSLGALKRKHVEALAAHWVEQGLSPSTVQNRISLLRTLAEWLGKSDMIGSAESLVSDPTAVRRSINATYDHSWTAAGVDVERMLAMVSAHDPHVGMQLRLCQAFYLRRQEAVMFRPHLADKGDCIVVRDGTKGGRERTLKVETAYQRQVLEQAKAMVKGVRGHIGHPNLTLEQALQRISTVCRRFGITKSQLGVTPYGLRHQGLNDLFEEVAGVPSPIRQKGAVREVLATVDKERLDLARARVSEAAGHARLSISGAYIGGLMGRQQTLSPAQQRHMQAWERFFELRGRSERTREEEAELTHLQHRLLSTSEPTVPAEG